MRHAPFVVGIIILLLLLIRNPFSASSEIANLEPFPDTLFYLSASRNILAGKGFVLSRFDQPLVPVVPILYPLSLLPIFALFSDPRSFYFTNVLLTVIGAGLFYKIISVFTGKKWIRYLTLLLYVTNPILTWYPTLAMAENLVIPLVLTGIYLLLRPASSVRMSLFAFVTVALYATKYACAPLSLILFIAYLVKISQFTPAPRKPRYFFLLISTSALYFLVFSLDLVLKHQPFSLYALVPFLHPLNLFSQNLSQANLISGIDGVNIFSFKYSAVNITHYIKGFLGFPVELLKAPLVIFPRYVGPIALLALLVTPLYPAFKAISTFLLLMFIGSLVFISTFYLTEFRYLYYLIPVFYLSLALLLTLVDHYLAARSHFQVRTILITLCFASFSLQSIPWIFTSLQDNFRPSFTPLNYVAATTFNDFFTSAQFQSAPQPVLLTVLPPYYLDFFSRPNYLILPLSSLLYLTPDPAKIYGPADYSSLIELYQSFLDSGHRVFLSPYTDQYQAQYVSDLRLISSRFNLQPLQHGCSGACDLYELLPLPK